MSGGGASAQVRSWPSVVVGMGLPTLALFGGVVALSGSGMRVLGLPVLYLWVFCCFPLTTVCLCASWRIFDRRHYAEPPATRGEGEY